MNAFAETKNLFAQALSYTKPLTFDQWMQLAGDSRKYKASEDLRAAALFVQFYDQITLAWYKVRSFYTLEEDGVSTMLQYLQKNVPVIAANPNRFTERYIYQVAFNCLYCICHDLTKERARFEKETSNLIGTDDGDLDLFDLVAARDTIEADVAKKEFWNIVYSACADADGFVDGVAEAVINRLLGGDASLTVQFTSSKKDRTSFGPSATAEHGSRRVSSKVMDEVVCRIREALVEAGYGM